MNSSAMILHDSARGCVNLHGIIPLRKEVSFYNQISSESFSSIQEFFLSRTIKVIFEMEIICFGSEIGLRKIVMVGPKSNLICAEL